ncbi:hypothetical protein B0A49_10120 [Cryomyces minteri]|uniref:Uncharacterized protein n=1 Tax=Cryomyces minteri TaxID=331657 RepID=A0A4V5NDN0_9PEZI|nr:hypothetical protein B0A49_10120 [Cryomyces minteri]
MVELIVGTIPEKPPIRLLAMLVSSLVFAFGVELLVVDACQLVGVREPVRISSLTHGEPLRPSIYSIIEDVAAVDGSGGTAFREHAAPADAVWAIVALVVAAATTAIVFTVQKDVAYVLGWVIPFAWAGVWAATTAK